MTRCSLQPLLALLFGCARLDREPPVIEVSVPDGPLSRTVTFEVAATDESPGVASVSAEVDGVPLAEGWTIDTRDLEDGLHSLTVRAEDAALPANTATVALTFEVDNTPPTVEVARESLLVDQGSTLALWFRTDDPVEPVEPVELVVDLLGEARPVYPVGALHRALVGVALDQEPGAWPLSVKATDAAGNVSGFAWDVVVAEVTWPEGGRLRFNKRHEPPSAAVARMRRERDGAYATVVPAQLWSGPMVLPCEGVYTSVYGSYRTYPNGEKSHHDAVDISNRPGTPVVAAARGVVLIARQQALLGDAVILGHGQGVTTSYNHLQEILVQEGQHLQQGDLVGRMGSTGRSTGPHLHWGMVVDEVAVDARQWLDHSFEEPEGDW